MANVAFSPLIADIRGSLASCTLTANRCGNVVRIKVHPYDPATLAQRTRRNIHMTAVQRWQDALFGAQRTAWNSLAAVTTLVNRAKQYYRPSGFQLFLSLYEFTYDMPTGPWEDAPAIAQSTPTPFTYNATIPNLSYNLVITADANWHTGKTGYLLTEVWQPFPRHQYTIPTQTPVRFWYEISELAALPYTIGNFSLPTVVAKAWVRTRAVYALGTLTIPETDSVLLPTG